MNTTTVIDALRDAGKRILADAEAAVRQAGIEPESVLVETIGGPAAEAIIAQAGSWPAELIVMGTHGRRGLARVAMGSDAEEVVRASPVPVLLVRGQLSAQAHASRAAA
jgi:nucleotide-binding universal stress UspA family protein